MKMRQERERIAVKDKELAEEKAKLIKIEGDRRKLISRQNSDKNKVYYKCNNNYYLKK